MKRYLSILIILLVNNFVVCPKAGCFPRVGTGGITGTYYDVKVLNEEIAYCTNNFGLVVMDISDPEHPEPVNIIPTSGKSLGLELRDGWLYLVDGYAGMRIYNISDDPLHPREVARVEAPDTVEALFVDIDRLTAEECLNAGNLDAAFSNQAQIASLYSKIEEIYATRAKKEAQEAMAGEFALTSVYPNPFNDVVRIEFTLPEESLVGMKIIDITGREVLSVQKHLTAGLHTTAWKADGSPAGLYFLKISAAG